MHDSWQILYCTFRSKVPRYSYGDFRPLNSSCKLIGVRSASFAQPLKSVFTSLMKLFYKFVAQFKNLTF